jgi:cell division inhibitor SepF
MGLGNVWNRALVYFGIAEDDDYWEEDHSAEAELERTYSERPNVRRLHRSRSRRDEEGFDDWSDQQQSPPDSRPAPSRERRPARPPLEAVAPLQTGAQKVHLVIPRSFNDAQAIADRFKDSVPVILNLQNADTELAKRLIDFSSGLTYALNGSMQRVADKVFLLTPRNVEVSAEERARMIDRGFFNQA